MTKKIGNSTPGSDTCKTAAMVIVSPDLIKNMTLHSCRNAAQRDANKIVLADTYKNLFKAYKGNT